MGQFPAVQKYCLMSAAGSWTDFHVDFGGTSVYYHVHTGKKTFYLVPPTEDNLQAYEAWITSPTQSQVFFPEWGVRSGADAAAGRAMRGCFGVEVAAGETLLIPGGWIHAVYTPADSLVFGGNFLHSFDLPLQLRIYQLETATRVHRKYMFPYFEHMLWYAAGYFLQFARLPSFAPLLERVQAQRQDGAESADSADSLPHALAEGVGLSWQEISGIPSLIALLSLLREREKQAAQLGTPRQRVKGQLAVAPATASQGQAVDAPSVQRPRIKLRIGSAKTTATASDAPADSAVKTEEEEGVAVEATAVETAVTAPVDPGSPVSTCTEPDDLPVATAATQPLEPAASEQTPAKKARIVLRVSAKAVASETAAAASGAKRPAKVRGVAAARTTAVLASDLAFSSSVAAAEAACMATACDSDPEAMLAELVCRLDLTRPYAFRDVPGKWTSADGSSPPSVLLRHRDPTRQVPSALTTADEAKTAFADRHSSRTSVTAEAAAAVRTAPGGFGLFDGALPLFEEETDEDSAAGAGYLYNEMSSNKDGAADEAAQSGRRRKRGAAVGEFDEEDDDEEGGPDDDEDEEFEGSDDDFSDGEDYEDAEDIRALQKEAGRIQRLDRHGKRTEGADGSDAEDAAADTDDSLRPLDADGEDGATSNKRARRFSRKGAADSDEDEAGSGSDGSSRGGVDGLAKNGRKRRKVSKSGEWGWDSAPRAAREPTSSSSKRKSAGSSDNAGASGSSSVVTGSSRSIVLDANGNLVRSAVSTSVRSGIRRDLLPPSEKKASFGAAHGGGVNSKAIRAILPPRQKLSAAALRLMTGTADSVSAFPATLTTAGTVRRLMPPGAPEEGGAGDERAAAEVGASDAAADGPGEQTAPVYMSEMFGGDNEDEEQGSGSGRQGGEGLPGASSGLRLNTGLPDSAASFDFNRLESGSFYFGGNNAASVSTPVVPAAAVDGALRPHVPVVASTVDAKKVKCKTDGLTGAALLRARIQNARANLKKTY
jgi:hypothetical protein